MFREALCTKKPPLSVVQFTTFVAATGSDGQEDRLMVKGGERLAVTGQIARDRMQPTMICVTSALALL